MSRSRITCSLLASVSILLFAGAQVYAQRSTNIHVTAGYYKGNSKYTIVVSDKAWTKLTMYVNDNQSTKATANKNGWATFNNVKLSDPTGQLSFSKMYNGKLQPIGGYFPWYAITGTKISFSKNPAGTSSQMSAWYSKYGSPGMATLTSDVRVVNSDGATNATAAEKACTQLFNDVIKLEAKPPIPNNTIENSWSDALDTLFNGATDCQYGAVGDGSTAQLTKGLGEISQGMTALNQTSKIFTTPATAATPAKSQTTSTTVMPTPAPAPAPAPVSTPSPAPTQSCYPLSDEGGCYEPGEYCRDSDHGASGLAGDGKSITCEDNDGWRWESN